VGGLRRNKMMYYKKFVASIKANGKVLRENNGAVAIPFGSEYEIRLKNINSIKAQVKVSIDGEDVTDGWIILQPNSTLDLERSIKNGNLKFGNKFKFIERTENIEKHRGIKGDDGLVRVEYRFEKIYPLTITSTPPFNQYPYVYYIKPLQDQLQDQLPYNSVGQVTCQNTMFAMNCSTEQINSSRTIENEVGITVPGGTSNQSFSTAYDFACEQSEVIVLKLIGKLNHVPVKRPITVDVKPTCSTCGRVNKATNKFCAECGTSLIRY
jgi:hypothetical protein